jgi:hypothetical protein
MSAFPSVTLRLAYPVFTQTVFWRQNISFLMR